MWRSTRLLHGRLRAGRSAGPGRQDDRRLTWVSPNSGHGSQRRARSGPDVARSGFRSGFPSPAAVCLLSLIGVAGFRSDSPASAWIQAGGSLEDHGLRAEDATRWELPRRLREISGLAMTPDHRLLAHHDEAGVVFEIDYRAGAIVKEFRLADMDDPVADDFEGIAVAEGRIYLVTSAGRLYECHEGAEGSSVLFTLFATGVGRDCEIEGLAYDEGARELLLMCKDPRSDDLAGKVAIYRWSIADQRLRDDAPIVIPARDFARRIGANRYRPSGIERHPVTGNYFVVAARQRAIAEVTPGGQVLEVRRFEAPWHRQVEGVTFGPDGSLIVADEGGMGRASLTLYPGPDSRD